MGLGKRRILWQRFPNRVKSNVGEVREQVRMRHTAVGTAPGKVILFGEHAVVYGEPAIAVPIPQLEATVTVEPAERGRGTTLIAQDLDRVIVLHQARADDPLAAMARLTLDHLNVDVPDATLTIQSKIPIASGLGSGTAVSTAMVRALASYFGRELAPQTVSRLVFEVERLHHGTPSGVDNTVVAFGMPVFFVKGQVPEMFTLGTTLNLIIGDSGVASSTRIAVAKVRRGWEATPDRYQQIFGRVGAIVVDARSLIETGGSQVRLGTLMDENHELLVELGVSCAELEHLVSAARDAGALGAKLSGAGLGGNMVALVRPETSARISDRLLDAGATRVVQAMLLPSARERGS
jgi:mevalonate kinase